MASMALTGKFIKAINPPGHVPAGFHIEAAGSVCIRKEKGKMRKEQLMCLSVISLRAGNTEKGIFYSKEQPFAIRAPGNSQNIPVMEAL